MPYHRDKGWCRTVNQTVPDRGIEQETFISNVVIFYVFSLNFYVFNLNLKLTSPGCFRDNNLVKL